MDVKKMTVGTLARQLSECNQNAEIVVAMGNIPMAIPASSISIRQNANNEEVVAINVEHEMLVQALDIGEKIMRGDYCDE